MSVTNKNSIQLYMHCKLCLEELKRADVYPPKSPESYSRLSVGWTREGLQVWCDRHKVNVIHIDFEGHTHPADLTRELPPLPKGVVAAKLRIV